LAALPAPGAPGAPAAPAAEPLTLPPPATRAPVDTGFPPALLAAPAAAAAAEDDAGFSGVVQCGIILRPPNAADGAEAPGVPSGGGGGSDKRARTAPDEGGESPGEAEAKSARRSVARRGVLARMAAANGAAPEAGGAQRQGYDPTPSGGGEPPTAAAGVEGPSPDAPPVWQRLSSAASLEETSIQPSIQLSRPTDGPAALPAEGFLPPPPPLPPPPLSLTAPPLQAQRRSYVFVGFYRHPKNVLRGPRAEKLVRDLEAHAARWGPVAAVPRPPGKSGTKTHFAILEFQRPEDALRFLEHGEHRIDGTPVRRAPAAPRPAAPRRPAARLPPRPLPRCP